MTTSKTLLILALIILIASNLFFGYQFYKTQAELTEVKKELRERQINDKALEFLKMFIDKVLKIQNLQEKSFTSFL